MCLCTPDWILIWKCWFLKKGKSRSTQRKSSRSQRENQQQTQPTCGLDTRIQTWVTLVDLWKASALTIVPPLLINIAAETKSTTSQASGRKHILVCNFPTKITSVQIIQQRFVSFCFVQHLYWFLLNFQFSIPLCALINQYFSRLAQKFPATKFLKSISTTCIPNYPDKHLPTIFIYFEDDMKRQFVGPMVFGGMTLKIDGKLIS